MNFTKSLIYIGFLLLVFGCSEAASPTTDSIYEKSANSAADKPNTTTPSDSIFRPELPLVAGKRELNYTIKENLSLLKNTSLTATVSIFSFSSGSTFKDTFTIDPKNDLTTFSHSGKIIIDDEILAGSKSSFQIFDGIIPIYSRSPVFNFKNDALFLLQIDSVVFSPPNSVKIGESFSIKVYVSYSGNFQDVTQVSFTGTQPNGGALTPYQFAVPADHKIWVFPAFTVPNGTQIGAYKRNFIAKDKYGNSSAIYPTTHSVIQ